MQRTPHPEDARVALGDIHRFEQAGLRRGLYTRPLIAVISLWAGAPAALVAWESPIWLGSLALGIALWYVRIYRTGVTLLEVRSARELWLVIPAGLFVGSLFIAGNIAYQDYGLSQAPWVAGIGVALILFILFETGRRSLGAEPAGRRTG